MAPVAKGSRRHTRSVPASSAQRAARAAGLAAEVTVGQRVVEVVRRRLELQAAAPDRAATLELVEAEKDASVGERCQGSLDAGRFDGVPDIAELDARMPGTDGGKGFRAGRRPPPRSRAADSRRGRATRRQSGRDTRQHRRGDAQRRAGARRTCPGSRAATPGQARSDLGIASLRPDPGVQPAAAIRSAVATRASAWRIEAMSIRRPSRLTAPLPSLARLLHGDQDAPGAVDLLGRRREDLVGQRHLLGVDRPLALAAQHRRAAAPGRGSRPASAKSPNGPSTGRRPLARAATTMRAMA